MKKAEYRRIEDALPYVQERLAGNGTKKLAYIRKQSLEAYAYLVETSRLLEE